MMQLMSYHWSIGGNDVGEYVGCGVEWVTATAWIGESMSMGGTMISK